MRIRVLAVAAIAALAGCTKTVFDGGPPPATLKFVNGIHGAVNLKVDGINVLTNVPLGGQLDAAVSSGSHSIVVERVGALSSAAQNISIAAGDNAIIVAFDAAGQTSASVLTDTNAVVPSGATKLRVAHFAQNAPAIDIWRTQPDYGTPIRVVFPFNYQFTSNYVQSTVGDWRVMVSSAVANPGDPMPDTLANTGLIAMASATSRTVIVVDGSTAGSVQAIVVNP